MAVHGASLTVVETETRADAFLFSVHLIPETLNKTTLRNKQKGDWVNIELDSHTKAVVSTVKKYLKESSSS